MPRPVISSLKITKNFIFNLPPGIVFASIEIDVYSVYLQSMITKESACQITTTHYS